MNLYLISQTENTGYDTFDSAVVAAETDEAAKRIHPITSWGLHSDGWDEKQGTWCKSPGAVSSKLIGVAIEGTAAGVVLASFLAG